MFRVTFCDILYGENVEDFENFADACNYWNDYAEVSTCVSGSLVDMENNETIWSFVA